MDMLTYGQMRAARGYLKWSTPQLAKKAGGLSAATVQRMETAEGELMHSIKIL